MYLCVFEMNILMANDLQSTKKQTQKNIGFVITQQKYIFLFLCQIFLIGKINAQYFGRAHC